MRLGIWIPSIPPKIPVRRSGFKNVHDARFGFLLKYNASGISSMNVLNFQLPKCCNLPNPSKAAPCYIALKLLICSSRFKANNVWLTHNLSYKNHRILTVLWDITSKIILLIGYEPQTMYVTATSVFLWEGKFRLVSSVLRFHLFLWWKNFQTACLESRPALAMRSLCSSGIADDVFYPRLINTIWLTWRLLVGHKAHGLFVL